MQLPGLACWASQLVSVIGSPINLIAEFLSTLGGVLPGCRMTSPTCEGVHGWPRASPRPSFNVHGWAKFPAVRLLFGQVKSSPQPSAARIEFVSSHPQSSLTRGISLHVHCSCILTCGSGIAVTQHHLNAEIAQNSSNTFSSLDV